ncbi:hypothetical protein [Pseudomonas sp. TNT3]|uniref:hypothetical protein n=1 Tax=Pseudomonas sp. TNT3 TaxID=2654097 RepID=UPI0013919946|nr:hypothetical protein [Pseudomonas sp. TNT3]KAI2687468.1 hypothetical protein GBC55_011970 [Pseudomonas sp. TNT3]
MEFKDVAEVIKAGTTTAANQLLDQGWTLLAVVAGEKGPDFVFGRAKGADPLPGFKKATVSAAALLGANRR